MKTQKFCSSALQSLSIVLTQFEVSLVKVQLNLTKMKTTFKKANFLLHEIRLSGFIYAKHVIRGALEPCLRPISDFMSF